MPSASNSAGNHLLSALPLEEYRRLIVHGEEISFDRDYVFYEAEMPIRDVYFPIDGMASVVTPLQDGETVALGGLIRDSINNDKTGVPILSSIPVVGLLFSTTTKSKSRTELMVLLSPKVVRNPKEARELTDELRNRVRAVKPLESRVQ